MTTAPEFRAAPPPILKGEEGTRIELLDRGELGHKTYTVRPSLVWRTFLLPSRAKREFQNLESARAAALPCVEPVEWRETRRWGCARRSALTWRFVPGRCLRDVLRRRDLTLRERRLVCRSLGDLLRKFHDAGHLWLTAVPRNVILPPEPSIEPMTACDLPYCVRFRGTIAGKWVARLDLFSLGFSPARLSEFSTRERRALLVSYCRGNRAEARKLWQVLGSRSPQRQRLAQGCCRAWYGVIVPAITQLLSALNPFSRHRRPVTTS